nr:uncharacterized protein LOC109165195 [Ipomoea batatas]
MYGQPSRGGGRTPFPTGANFNRNPNPYYPFQPQPSRPTSGVDRIDKAVLKAHREILATGEVVSAWKVSQAALVILQADTWDSLGFQMQQVPSLHRLMLTEGKINAFIHCFVGARRITTLHDLEIAICNTEGVERFEDLELGPLVKHPLIIHYFSLSADVTEVCRITSEEIVALLSEFMDMNKQRKIEVEELLDFIAKKKSVTAKEKLGVRIQSLGMHITLIRQAWQLEITTVAEEITRLGCSKNSKQSKRKRKYSNIQSPVTSPQKVLKTKSIQTPFSRKERKKNSAVKQEPTDSIDCSYSSDSMKMFITTWKETCQANNVDEVWKTLISLCYKKIQSPYTFSLS